jgi:dethiobiotin synthetase
VRGVFVTGTDTEVGKTVLAAALTARLAQDGPVGAFKPVVTGLDEPDPHKPPDHVLLAQCAGVAPADVAMRCFGPPVSPHLAAELAGTRIEPEGLLACARRAAQRGPLVVEGVGGFLVPMTPLYLVRDFAQDLGLPVVIAARPDLGTINHSLLTVHAVRAAGLEVRAVVFTPWPAEPTAAQRSNCNTVAALGEVEVVGLPRVESFEPATLAAAAADLPVHRWIGDARTTE